MMNLTLRQLQAFVLVVQTRQFTLAAHKMHITQSALSTLVKELESSVGLKLLDRHTRRVEPTEIGLRLYEHGRAIQSALIAARESVSMLGQNQQGRVRLSVPSGYGQLVMADLLIAFKREHPGIVLDVMFENRVEDLLRDEVDIAVRVMSEPPQSLVARDMGPVRYVACTSAA